MYISQGATEKRLYRTVHHVTVYCGKCDEELWVHKGTIIGPSPQLDVTGPGLWIEHVCKINLMATDEEIQGKLYEQMRTDSSNRGPQATLNSKQPFG